MTLHRHPQKSHPGRGVIPTGRKEWIDCRADDKSAMFLPFLLARVNALAGGDHERLPFFFPQLPQEDQELAEYLSQIRGGEADRIFDDIKPDGKEFSEKSFRKRGFKFEAKYDYTRSTPTMSLSGPQVSPPQRQDGKAICYPLQGH